MVVFLAREAVGLMLTLLIEGVVVGYWIDARTYHEVACRTKVITIFTSYVTLFPDVHVKTCRFVLNIFRPVRIFP